MPTGGNGDKGALGHVKPIAAGIALEVGLNAQVSPQVIEKTDVEIGDLPGQLLQQLHRLLDVAEHRLIALGLLDDMGQQLADEQGDGIFHRVAVQGCQRVAAAQLAQHRQVAPRAHSSLELHQRERHEHGVAHPRRRGLTQWHGKRHQPAPIGVDVHDVVLVAISHCVQDDATQFLIHGANLLISRQSRGKKVQKTQLFLLFDGLNFVNSKNSTNFAVAFAEKIRFSAHSSIG